MANKRCPQTAHPATFVPSGFSTFIRAFLTVPMIAMAIGSTIGTAVASPLGAMGGPPKLAPRPSAPLIRNHGVRPYLGSGQTYTISDLGAPPSNTYTDSYPIAFNNTGQIFGRAISKKRGVSDCVVYTGHAKFLDLTPSANDTGCSALGMSSADANGVARLVGLVTTPFNTGNTAFFATLTVATGKGSLTMFTANSFSGLFGVNASGEAIGSAYYSPLGGFFSSGPDFVVPPGGKKLVVAQPQCVVGNSTCALPLVYACTFGGCTINDQGTILGYDGSTGNEMTYTYGQPASGKDLPIVATSASFLNNANQVLYNAYDANRTHYNAYVYSVANGTTTTIPPIAGSSCAYYYISSFNNAGQALGFTEICGSSADYVYWIWDAVNGTQNLNAEIPTNTYEFIEPRGVNDSGQILVALHTSDGITDWGTLNPPAAARTQARQRFTPRR